MINKVTEVRDNYFVSYGVFYSMGVLTFVPYYFFIISTHYWMFKFRDPTRRPVDSNSPPDAYPSFTDLHSIVQGPSDDGGLATDRTPLQATFTSSFLITNMVSLLAFLVIVALCTKKLPPQPKRIQGALLAMLVLFVINTSFTKLNTDSFQKVFFGITLVLAVLLNACSAIIMISLFELVVNFPLDYFGTILSGQAICGILSSLLQIAILSLRVTFLMRGLIFFTVGTHIILATTIFFLLSKRKSKYFIYRIGQGEGNPTDQVSSKWSVDMDRLRKALHDTKWFLGTLVFVQGSTAMVHPGLAALIVSTERDNGLGGEWNEIYFVPVVTFFGFHTCDLVGRELARKIKRPRNAFAILALASVRLILVPLLMLCNAQPRRTMPVVFGDELYIVLISVFGLTQGYLVNLCIISVPRVAKKEDLEVVTLFLPLVSILSSTICSTFNLVIINLI